MARMSNLEAYHAKCVNAYKSFMDENSCEPLLDEFKDYLVEHDIFPPVGVDKDIVNANELSKVRTDVLSKYPEYKELASLAATDFQNEEYAATVEDVISKAHTFIITTYVSQKSVVRDFYESMINYARRNDAEILVLPSFDAYSKSRKSKDSPKIDWYIDSYIAKTAHIITHDIKLTHNLLLSGIQVTAKQKNPLSSLGDIHAQTECHVIASGVVQLLMHTAREKDKHPWVRMTPGACSAPDYNEDYSMSKAMSYNAEKRHTIGAIIVHTEPDGTFYFRQVQSGADGSFYDLGTLYKPNGDAVECSEAVFVTGDIHAGNHDEELMKEVDKFLLENDYIKTVVVHDLCDGISKNPHNSDKCLEKSLLYINGPVSIKEDVKNACNIINEFTSLRSDIGLLIVPSNHDDFILRAMNDLNSYRPGPDYPDIIKYCAYRVDVEEYNKQVIEYNKATGTSDYAVSEPITPLQYFAEIRYNLVNDKDRVKWLKENQSYQMYGTELGHHGNYGANGAKGSITTYSKMERSEVIGHSHTAGIRGGVYQVGTFCKLDQGYNKGPSSWTHTGCIVYPGAQKQLITFVNTKGGYKYKP